MIIPNSNLTCTVSNTTFYHGVSITFADRSVFGSPLMMSAGGGAAPYSTRTLAAVNFRFDLVGTPSQCVAVLIIAEDDLPRLSQSAVLNGPTSQDAIFVCPNTSYVYLPYVSVSSTIYVNGSEQLTYKLNALEIGRDETAFAASNIQLVNSNTEYDVSTNELVIRYRWTDLVSATAGIFSLSVSIWMFVFPTIAPGKHRRWFVLDRLIAHAGCADSDRSLSDGSEDDGAAASLYGAFVDPHHHQSVNENQSRSERRAAAPQSVGLSRVALQEQLAQNRVLVEP